METSKGNEKQLNIILFSIAGLFLVYTTLRAYLMSITWDEAATYIEYVRNGKIILNTYDFMSANNHILNTFLMVVFTKAFGVSEFVMRIPSLMAHVLFLFYSLLLLKNLGNKWLVIAAFIIVNANPYLLDFFSVARGYGLSIGLMMTSIYYFYLFHVREEKGRYATITIFTGGVAVIANFVLLNYCLVVFGLIVLLSIYFSSLSDKSSLDKAKSAIRMLAVPTLLMLILLLFVIPITMQLKDVGALFFGGEEGFWKSTVNTIIDRSFYELGYNYLFQRLTKWFIIIVLISATVLVVFRFLKKKMESIALFLMSLLLLIGLCSLSTVIQRFVFGTPYLLDRTALFLMVLFSLIFVFFIGVLAKEKKSFMWISCISAIPVLIHLFWAFNLTYVLEWKPDADTKEMLEDLDKIKKIPKGKETISIGMPLIFEASTNYYRERNNLFWINTASRFDSRIKMNDYFFLTPKELLRFDKDSFQIIKRYPVTGNVMAKATFTPKEIHESIRKEISFEDLENEYFVLDSTKEYGPGFSIIVSDSLIKEKGVLAFDADVFAPDTENDNLVMVFSFQNKKGETYKWKKAYVKDFIRNDTDWFRASFTCQIPEAIQPGDEVKAFIWNPEKQIIFIQKQEFKWLEYHYK
jgi:hypothetical protein